MDTKPSSSRVYPKIINHIAVSVPNLEEAVKWYKEVLGFTVIKQRVEFVADDSNGYGCERYPWYKVKENADGLVKFSQPSGF